MNDEMCGKGIYRDANQQILYDGQWLANEKHGFGIENFCDGGKYEGQYVKG